MKIEIEVTPNLMSHIETIQRYHDMLGGSCTVDDAIYFAVVESAVTAGKMIENLEWLKKIREKGDAA